jgi:hypothetical protein
MGVTFVFRSTVVFTSSLHALPHSAFRASLRVFTGFVSIILQACGLAREYQSHADPRVGAAPRSSRLIRFVDEMLAERRRCLPEKMPRANE